MQSASSVSRSGLTETGQAPRPTERLVGNHPSIRDLRHLVERIGRSPARTVMIYGETGTGKSFVSRIMHDCSSRAAGRFVDVNCAAIPPTLVESELFGHTKGSFTGAATGKIGLVEAAHGGTLFLDEISELDLTMQAKLLTVLDTHQLRRVGGVDNISVDLRLVAATNRMLLTEAAKGRFREELFYRLQLVFIRIPPLRERGDDVFLLTDHYIRKFSRSYGGLVKVLDREVQHIFATYRWPGNVRELAHLVERLYILSDSERVGIADLPPRMTNPEFWDSLGRVPGDRLSGHSITPGEASVWNLDEATLAFQRSHIRQALDRYGQNVARAAGALGLSRHALRYRMMKLGIQAPAAVDRHELPQHLA